MVEPLSSESQLSPRSSVSANNSKPPRGGLLNPALYMPQRPPSILTKRSARTAATVNLSTCPPLERMPMPLAVMIRAPPAVAVRRAAAAPRGDMATTAPTAVTAAPRHRRSSRRRSCRRATIQRCHVSLPLLMDRVLVQTLLLPPPLPTISAPGVLGVFSREILQPLMVPRLVFLFYQ